MLKNIYDNLVINSVCEYTYVCIYIFLIIASNFSLALIVKICLSSVCTRLYLFINSPFHFDLAKPC